MTDKLKHLPGCPHVQNMARPRSQQLIGPICTCGEYFKHQEELKKKIDSGEFDEALGIINED